MGRFRNEVEILRRLNHDHIIKLVNAQVREDGSDDTRIDSIIADEMRWVKSREDIQINSTSIPKEHRAAWLADRHAAFTTQERAVRAARKAAGITQLEKRFVRFYSVIFALGLTACASAPKMMWLRADGQPAANDPVLAQQFQMDRTVCLGEREKADLSGVTLSQGGFAGIVAAQNRLNAADTVAQGCMAQKGYVFVREDEAPAKQQELAAIAAEKARRDVAAAAPPPSHVAAKPKPKPPQPSPPPAQPVSQSSGN